nr:MAG TPA: hypothetical protein [Caudoviricetes sp.]
MNECVSCSTISQRQAGLFFVCCLLSFLLV